MTFELKIDIDNAAFNEIARILRATADKLETANWHRIAGRMTATGTLHDVNGNSVGEWKYSKE